MYMAALSTACSLRVIVQVVVAVRSAKVAITLRRDESPTLCHAKAIRTIVGKTSPNHPVSEMNLSR